MSRPGKLRHTAHDWKNTVNLRLNTRVVNQKLENTGEFTSERAITTGGGGTFPAHSPSSCIIPYCKLCAAHFAHDVSVTLTGGSGGKPPAELDTSGICVAKSRKKKVFSSRCPKDFRYLQPVSRSLDDWRQSYGDWIYRLGGSRALADSVRTCGAMCRVIDCHGCGEKNASVQVVAGCQTRACPYCARKDAAQSVREITHKARQVPALTMLRALEISDTLKLKRQLLHEKIEMNWVRFFLATTERAKNYYVRVCESQAEQLDRIDQDIVNLRPNNVLKWRWREITLTVRWRPNDPEQYTTRGLKNRLNTVLSMWNRFRSLCAFAGVATSMLNVELSNNGFVHGHVLFFGPFIPYKWLTQQMWLSVPYAGYCTVGTVHDGYTEGWATKKTQDLEHQMMLANDPSLKRQLRKQLEKHKKRAKSFSSVLSEKALKEAVKYHVKAPSVLHHEWVQGQPFNVIHPKLAASWVLATRGVQLRRFAGTILQTTSLDAEKTETEQKSLQCPTCKCDLIEAYSVQRPSTIVAREMGVLWGERLQIVSRRIRAP